MPNVRGRWLSEGVIEGGTIPRLQSPASKFLHTPNCHCLSTVAHNECQGPSLKKVKYPLISVHAMDKYSIGSLWHPKGL